MTTQDAESQRCRLDRQRRVAVVQVPERIRWLGGHRQGHVQERYTPDEDGGDSGYYLRATAKYKDRQSPSGADNDKTASMVSANKVLVLRTSNEVPEFAAVQDPDGVRSC